MALVIQSWEASNEPVNGQYVKIVGRHPGYISWLLFLLGLDATTTVIVTEREVITQDGIVPGNLKLSLPLDKIALAYSGFIKPWKTSLGVSLALALSFGIKVNGNPWEILMNKANVVAIAPIFYWLLLAGLVFYALNQKICLAFVGVHGGSKRICFKRSVVNGKVVDAVAAANVVNIIEMLLDKQQRGK